MELFSLKGRVALITGGTRGIGRAIARLMAEAGASVVVASRKPENCDLAAAEIVAAGGRAIGVACNVGRLDQHPQLIDRAHKAFGHIDIFVGNAAANPHHGPVTDISENAFDKIFDTNVKANLWLCKALLPSMAANGGGAVVLISSVSSLMGNDDIGAYGASKAALNAMVRNLAVGWGPSKINVNAIAPGLVRTDFASALVENDEMRTRIEQVTPLRRIGHPDDVAGLAVLLASAAGRHISGQVIVVDGGASIASQRITEE